MEESLAFFGGVSVCLLVGELWGRFAGRESRKEVGEEEVDDCLSARFLYQQTAVTSNTSPPRIKTTASIPSHKLAFLF